MLKFARKMRCLASLALVLALLMPVLAFAQDGPVYVNDLIKSEDERIELRFLNTALNDKTDATLALCYGKEGLQVVVIDGGLANSRCYMELLALRRELLEEAGLSGHERDQGYQLRLTLLATHCHKDHVAELYSSLLPAKLLTVESLYLPPATALTSDGTYDNSKNGDLVHRVRLQDAMKHYAPQAELHMLDYGQTLELPLACGKATLYAPLQDWGEGEALKYIEDVYYGTATAAKRKADVPVAVVNANSMWIRLTLGDSSALFTGDIMKKKNRSDEPFDRMIDAYGESLRSNVVKYPHHGVSRNPAAVGVAQRLMAKDGVAVLTTKGARDASGAQLAALGANYVTTEDGSYVFILRANNVEYALQ